MQAQSDAFERGVASTKTQPRTTHFWAPNKTISELTRAERNELRRIKAEEGMIPAIRRVREFTDISLRDAKYFIENLRDANTLSILYR